VTGKDVKNGRSGKANVPRPVRGRRQGQGAFREYNREGERKPLQDQELIIFRTVKCSGSLI
jgi:hypothetical protein